MEILAGGEKSLHQKRSFHQVAAVVEHSKYRHGFSGVSVHVVRPSAVVAIRVFKETDNLGKAIHALFARDESTIHSDHQGSDAKTAGAGGNDAVVSGDALPGHARMRISALPVVAEAGCLQHGKEFVVGEFARGSAGSIGHRRLFILAV